MNLFNYETYEDEIIKTHIIMQTTIIPNCENAHYEKDLFTIIDEIVETIKDYKNIDGNCYLCALCDLFNITEHNGKKYYTPMPRKSNPNGYHKLVGWYRWQAEAIKKEYNIKNLKDLYDLQKNCLVSICNNGGYHMIAYVNGLFYNNWSNRKGLTYDELLKDLNYSKMPKMNYIIADEKLNAKLEQALKYNLIIERK